MDIYIVSTPYHLIVSASRSKYGDILVLSKTFNIGDILHKLIKRYFGDNVVFVKPISQYKDLSLFIFRNNMKKIQKIFKNKYGVIDNIFVFNDVDPNAQWLISNIDYRGTVCLYEEGTGLYEDAAKKYEWFFRQFGKMFFGLHYENIARIGESTFIDEICCAMPHLLSKRQKEKKIGKMPQIELDEDLMEDVKLAIPYLESNWFLGQPMVENGAMKEGEYLELIRDLIHLSPEEKTFVIKPHPREDKTKYNDVGAVVFDNNEIPFELLECVIEGKIYSINSSALMHVSDTKNKAVALFKILSLNQPNLERLFGEKNIFVPESWEELESGGLYP